MTIRLILLILITNFVFAKDSIETWGYLMKGEESYFPKDPPLLMLHILK